MLDVTSTLAIATVAFMVMSLLRRCWSYYNDTLRAQCSPERLLHLRSYASNEARSSTRMLFVLFLTPLPALVSMTLVDAIPLSAPSMGISHSLTTWIRAWIASMYISSLLLLQLHCMVPEVKICVLPGLLVAASISTGTVLYDVLLASYIGYPLPFTFNCGSPMFVLLFSAGIYGLIGRKQLCRREQRYEVFKFFLVISVQLTLTLIYPLFNVAFVSVGKVAQMAMAVCLPATKLVLKFALASVMKPLPDLKPRFVILNVEVFHALFISVCMQSSASSVTTALLVTLDVCNSVYAITKIRRRARHLEAIISSARQRLSRRRTTTAGPEMPATNSRAHLPIVDAILYLLRDPKTHSAVVMRQLRPPVSRSLHAVFPTNSPEVVNSNNPISLRKLQGIKLTLTPLETALLDSLSDSQRLTIVNQGLDLLLSTESLMLTEYVEVVVPIIYSLYLSVLFYLPNRMYYLQLKHLTKSTLQTTIANVMIYASLELLTFLPLDAILRRRLGFRPIHQLAFVLDHDWWLVQAKLTIWLVYMMQSSLEQFGVDFTFKFAWLKETIPTL